MKVAKIRLNSPAEGPEPTKKEEMIAHVNTVVEHIKSFSNFSDWQAQSIVFWCIATYGYEELRKFPILVIMGAYRTGKTTALEMVQTLANPPFLDEKASEELRRNEMMQVGSITPSVTDKLLSRGGTHCLDEADAWDEDYLTKVFDKKSGSIKKNENQRGSNWTLITVNVYTALALNRRKQFEDPANKDRCIIIRTRKTASGSLDTEPDMSLLAPYAERLQDISHNLCDWESIPESGTSRPAEKWRIVMHVAEKLGFDEYVRKAEREIERDLKDTDVSEEENIAVFRTIFKATATFEQGGETIKELAEWVTTKDVRERLDQEGHKMASHAINANAKDMGFQQIIRAGESRIYNPAPPEERLDKLIEIANRIGYEDDSLKH